jgi:hypothetical protein
LHYCPDSKNYRRQNKMTFSPELYIVALKKWGGVMFGFFRTTRELEYYFFIAQIANFCFQNLTLGYMTKTLNQIIFFSSTKIRFEGFETKWYSFLIIKKQPMFQHNYKLRMQCALTGPRQICWIIHIIPLKDFYGGLDHRWWYIFIFHVRDGPWFFF